MPQLLQPAPAPVSALAAGSISPTPPTNRWGSPPATLCPPSSTSYRRPRPTGASQRSAFGMLPPLLRPRCRPRSYLPALLRSRRGFRGGRRYLRCPPRTDFAPRACLARLYRSARHRCRRCRRRVHSSGGSGRGSRARCPLRRSPPILWTRCARRTVSCMPGASPPGRTGAGGCTRT